MVDYREMCHGTVIHEGACSAYDNTWIKTQNNKYVYIIHLLIYIAMTHLLKQILPDAFQIVSIPYFVI